MVLSSISSSAIIPAAKAPRRPQGGGPAALGRARGRPGLGARPEGFAIGSDPGEPRLRRRFEIYRGIPLQRLLHELDEDRQGRPFVGPAGQFLDELLASINLKRSDVFITNVVKCRPPNNRDPEPGEIAACNDYLDRQIAAINPGVIVTLGRHSMAKFFGSEKVSMIHGRARRVDGRICIAMYHPAAGLHQTSLKDTIRADFKKIPMIIEQAARMDAESKAKPEPPPVKEEPPQQMSLF